MPAVTPVPESFPVATQPPAISQSCASSSLNSSALFLPTNKQELSWHGRPLHRHASLSLPGLPSGTGFLRTMGCMRTAGYALVDAGRARKVAANVNLGLREDTDSGGENKQLSVLLYANTERQYRLFGTGSPPRTSTSASGGRDRHSVASRQH